MNTLDVFFALLFFIYFMIPTVIIGIITGGIVGFYDKADRFLIKRFIITYCISVILLIIIFNTVIIGEFPAVPFLIPPLCLGMFLGGFYRSIMFNNKSRK